METPKSYLTDADREGLEGNTLYLAESDAADDAGDEGAAEAWMRKCQLPASALLFLKMSRGADHLRDGGYDLSAAEKRFGKDWLDREITG